jgi:Phage Mu protein F like protein.
MIVYPKMAPLPVRKMSPAAWWTALHRVADDLEPSMRMAFLRAVRMVQARLDLVNVIDALQRGQIDQSALWQALESELDSAMRSPMREALLGGADVASRKLPGMRFDLTNPAAVQAVDTEVANLVRDITEQSRQAIRDLVRQSVQGNFDVRQLAQQVKGSIGLTPQYAVATERYRQSLVDNGLSEGRALTRAQAYADRLLRHRAVTIARTEVIRATNAGQQTVWRDAQQEGLLGFDAQRTWIVTPDDRLCELCAPMDGQTVGLNEPFQSDEGPVDYPPLHPNCRCAVGIAQTEEA